MKIAVPAMNDAGKESLVSTHFGHTQFVFVYDTETKVLSRRECSRHEENRCTPVDSLVGVDKVFVLGIGSRAIKALEEVGVELVTGDCSTVSEVINNIDSLRELKGSCGH